MGRRTGLADAQEWRRLISYASDNMNIGIIDYGASNIASVLSAMDELGEAAKLVTTPEEISNCERLILPGVGAMPHAMAALRERELDTAIIEAVVEGGKPCLGICLGMQMMTESSEEGGTPIPTLDLCSGTCIEIPQPLAPYTVPHMGWAVVSRTQEHPVFEGIRPDATFYFCHSFHVFGSQAEIASAQHSAPITAALLLNNMIGVQFHPERSGPNGLRLIENFIDWSP